MNDSFQMLCWASFAHLRIEPRAADNVWTVGDVCTLEVLKKKEWVLSRLHCIEIAWPADGLSEGWVRIKSPAAEAKTFE